MKILKAAAALLLCAALLAPVCAAASVYSDVESGAWYAKAAGEMYEKQIMVGSGRGTFMPQRGITRAACIACMCRAAGAEAAGDAKSVFTDCGDCAFLPYIMWGYENGLCAGFGGRFFPYDYLKREQLAVILMKTCALYGIENRFVTNLSAEDFGDFPLTSPYARDAVKWCVEQGYFSGTAVNTLAPWKYVSRAEFAYILSCMMYVRENSALPADEADTGLYPVKETDRTRIVCWGDSLTAGAGVTPYPQILREKLKTGVANYGVGGETAELIAMRQGSLPVYAAPFVIPEDTSETKITFLNDRGEKTDLSYFGTNGLNSVIIAGVEGNVYYSAEEQSVIFRRCEKGAGVTLNRVTRVITKGMRDRNTGDISIFFLGTNNCFTFGSCGYFISLLDRMIEYSGSGRYLVIGLTTRKYSNDAFEINKELEKHFGGHFLDIRAYLAGQGLADAGITPTEQDLKDIAEGEIPVSLRKDNVHGNTVYYTLLAEQIIGKFRALGYID